MKAPLLLALLLAVPAAAQDGPDFKNLFKNGTGINGKVPKVDAAEYPDLKHEFLDPPTRDQSQIGSCHAFAAVAIAEAAYYRQHRHRIRFSEEDVFLQATILNGDAHQSPCAAGSASCALQEGNYVDQDIDQILEKGVLLGSQYGEFTQRYLKYSKEQAGMRAGLADMKEKASWLDKMFLNKQFVWHKYLADPQVRAGVIRQLSKPDAQATAERDKIRNLMKGSRPRTKHFDFLDGTKLSAEDCGAQGKDRLAAIIGELELARPVAVAMHLSGLAAWGQTDGSPHAYHAFVITGYDRSKDGQLLLKVRNSWAGVNPDVPASDACRIFQLDTILAPGERETF